MGSFMEMILEKLGLEEEAEILPRENKGEDFVAVNMVDNRIDIEWLH